MELIYTIRECDIKLNIKELLHENFNISTRLYQKLLRHSAITINENIYYEKQHINLAINDIIKVNFDNQENNSNIVPTKMDLDIIYEDEWLIIVNKPVGIPVHPSNLHYEDSLSNGIRAYFDSIGLRKTIRPVNRIDLNTSGLVVFAKCEYIHSVLSLEMQNKKFIKKYLCIVEGTFKEKSGTIDFPISRKKDSIIERCVSPHGQKSITHFSVLQETNNLSLVECKLETGRTHQIRVHMSYIGHPILGDSLYGTFSNLIEGQALHSYYISFIHPISKKQLEFTCKPKWTLFDNKKLNQNC